MNSMMKLCHGFTSCDNKSNALYGSVAFATVSYGRATMRRLLV